MSKMRSIDAASRRTEFSGSTIRRFRSANNVSPDGIKAAGSAVKKWILFKANGGARAHGFGRPDQGLSLAQHKLGGMYGNGRGVPQDDVEAVKWCRLAADRGFAAAQLKLGESYALGRGVLQDYILAHMWLNLASAQDKRASPGEAAKSRDEVATKMTPDQIAEAQRLAREWKPTK